MADDEPKTKRRRPPSAARPTKAVPESQAVVPLPADGSREVAEAERIHVEGGRVGQATSKALTVQRGAIGRADAESVLVTQGAIGGARADRVELKLGALGGVVAGSVSVQQGYVSGILARDVSFELAGVRTVIANRVTMGPQSGALVVIARTVEGGRALVDWRGAIAFGAAFALVSAFLRGRLRGR